MSATNFKDCGVQVGVCTDGKSPVWAGACACVTCGLEMPFCWDTVCHDCGDTSCYSHSWQDGPLQVVGGFAVKDAGPAYWYCEKCAKKHPTSDQRHIGTPEEEAEKEVIRDRYRCRNSNKA